MKRLLSILSFILVASASFAQVHSDYFIGRTLSIGRGNKFASPNSFLDIGDTAAKKGMYIPRVIHRDSVPNPEFGMLVYDKSDNNYYGRTRTTWLNLSTGGGVTWGSIPGNINSQSDLIALLNAKQAFIPLGTSSQYYRGDKTMATLDKAAVGLSLVQNLDQRDAANLTLGIIPSGRYGPGSIPLLSLDLLGSPSSTTFIRGDGTWGTPAINWGQINGSIIDQNDLSAALAFKEYSGNKGLPNGYASLNSAGIVPANQLGTLSDPAGALTYFLRRDGTWQPAGSGGASTWGSISGTLASQTDLQTALNGKQATITPATTSDYYRGDKTFQPLNRAAVGLGNVDNTSDANKPISTATQTALNGKEPAISAGTISDYWRGDKTFQPLNKAAVGLGNVLNVDQTDASNITSGILADGRLSSNIPRLNGNNVFVDDNYIEVLMVGELTGLGEAPVKTTATGQLERDVYTTLSNPVGSAGTNLLRAISPTNLQIIQIAVTGNGTGTLTNDSLFTINITGGGSGISDGDKGDITVGSSGTAWTIDNSAVTYAKMQNVSASGKLLGRYTTGAGVVQEITIGSGLSLDGSGNLTATGGGSGLADGDKGDITVGSSATVFTIDNDVVTDAKLRNSTALSVIGRSSNSTGDPADIAAANDAEVLRRNGSSIGFGQIATGGITDAAVTYAKIQNVSASGKLLGRYTTGAGVVQEITIGSGLSLDGSGNLTATGGGSGLADGDKGDITVGSSATVFTIDNDVVTDAKLRNSAALSVIGRSSNSTGDPADIAAANDAEVLRRNGNSIGFGQIATGGITDAAVTYAKMQNVSASGKLLGRYTTGAGVVQEITIGSGLSLDGSGNLTASGTTAPPGTDGYMPYNNGGSWGATGLYYDDVNDRYGIGTNSPQYRLDIQRNTASDNALLRLYNNQDDRLSGFLMQAGIGEIWNIFAGGSTQGTFSNDLGIFNVTDGATRQIWKDDGTVGLPFYGDGSTNRISYFESDGDFGAAAMSSRLGISSGTLDINIGSLITAGAGITVTGAGSVGSPYNVAQSVPTAGSSYTPTLTAVTNATSPALIAARYDRTGTTVTVSGRGTFVGVAVGTVEVRISLPVASDFTTSSQADGWVRGTNMSWKDGYVYSDATNNQVVLLFEIPSDFMDPSGTGYEFRFLFQYEIVTP